jgi:FMN phosphatase YigB (HAD superfamily)
MITSLVFDFSFVLLFSKDASYTGKLNDLNDKLSAEENYEPLDYFRVNDELIYFLKQYKNEYTFYIFTAGKMHKLPSLHNKLNVVFSQYLSESDVGLPKSNPEAFTKLSQMINMNVDEILFIDDKIENVNAATQAGMKAIQYLNNDQLKFDLSKVL